MLLNEGFLVTTIRPLHNLQSQSWTLQSLQHWFKAGMKQAPAVKYQMLIKPLLWVGGWSLKQQLNLVAGAIPVSGRATPTGVSPAKTSLVMHLLSSLLCFLHLSTDKRNTNWQIQKYSWAVQWATGDAPGATLCEWVGATGTPQHCASLGGRLVVVGGTSPATATTAITH